MKTKLLLFLGLIFNITGIAFSQNQIIIGDTMNMNYTVVSASQGNSFGMDIDSNGSTDFVIWYDYYVGTTGPSATVSIQPLGFNKEKCAMSTSPYLPIPLDSLDTLDYNGIWIGGGGINYWLIADFYNEAHSHIQIGAWSSKTKYLGILLSDGVDTLLGWIKIEVGPFGSTYFKVLEYACQNGNLNDINDFITDSYKIYPNPSSSNIYINTDNDIKSTFIRILDITGRLIKQETIKTKKTELDISNLQNGLYIIEIINNSRCFKYKFLKE